jgi:hypothetical protein
LLLNIVEYWLLSHQLVVCIAGQISRSIGTARS